MGGVLSKPKVQQVAAPVEEKPEATTAQTDAALQRQAQARARRGGRSLLGENTLTSKTTLGS